MGNLCGKSSKDENFHGPGRTLGSAPAPATKASVPARVANEGPATSSKPKVTGPGRTVGGASANDTANDPRAAAAAAAEVRSDELKKSGNPAVKPMVTTVWM